MEDYIYKMIITKHQLIALATALLIPNVFSLSGCSSLFEAAQFGVGIETIGMIMLGLTVTAYAVLLLAFKRDNGDFLLLEFQLVAIAVYLICIIAQFVDVFETIFGTISASIATTYYTILLFALFSGPKNLVLKRNEGYFWFHLIPNDGSFGTDGGDGSKNNGILNNGQNLPPMNSGEQNFDEVISDSH